jgi:transcriptional regulator with XRE-family HTH domain
MAEQRPEPIHTSEPDALDEMIAERTAANPHFPELLAAAQRRRELLRTLAEERRHRAVSQTQLAATMNTSQSTLARLETSAADTKLSTVERYAAALGLRVEYRLVEASQPDGRSALVACSGRNPAVTGDRASQPDGRSALLAERREPSA